jgi:hypothetical protein
MTVALWAIIVAAFVVVGVAYLIASSKGFARGYANGYEVGRSSERQAMARVLNGMRQRRLEAERDIDYLYERARWQISHQSPPARPDSGERDG